MCIQYGPPIVPFLKKIGDFTHKVFYNGKAFNGKDYYLIQDVCHPLEPREWLVRVESRLAAERIEEI